MKSIDRRSLINLIITSSALILSVLALVSAVFAWYAFNDTTAIDGVNLRVIDIEESGYVISSVNDIGSFADSVAIWPNDIFKFELSATKNDSALAVTFTNLTENDDQTFTNNVGRAAGDLLKGPYEKLSNITGLGNVYLNFDIDKHFTGSALSGNAVHAEKIRFLKYFADSNNIVSAFTAKVVSITRGGVTSAVDIDLVRQTEDDTVLHPETAVVLDKDDTVTVEVTYGRRTLTVDGKEVEWLPEMEILSDTVFAAAKYRAHNLNCFIGQIVTINFGNKTTI